MSLDRSQTPAPITEGEDTLKFRRVMDGSREPLLGRSTESDDLSHGASEQGRSIDLPPLQPSAGMSQTVPGSVQDHMRAKDTVGNEEHAVGERGELQLPPISSTTFAGTQEKRDSPKLPLQLRILTLQRLLVVAIQRLWDYRYVRSI